MKILKQITSDDWRAWDLFTWILYFYRNERPQPPFIFEEEVRLFDQLYKNIKPYVSNYGEW